jgi:hypothetical protein
MTQHVEVSEVVNRENEKNNFKVGYQRVENKDTRNTAWLFVII